jgi:heme-degrading monooxygenase HmoA
MILEHAWLQVRPGQEQAFERAFARASPIIARQRGHLGHRLEQCLERPGTYLLLVEWETLEDHVEGFRGSADYADWKRLLHHFYEPFPEVFHFRTLHRGSAATGA